MPCAAELHHGVSRDAQRARGATGAKFYGEAVENNLERVPEKLMEIMRSKKYF